MVAIGTFEPVPVLAVSDRVEVLWFFHVTFALRAILSLVTGRQSPAHDEFAGKVERGIHLARAAGLLRRRATGNRSTS